MIKAKVTIDGRETLVLGLSKENIKRLKAGQPIHFHGKSVEIDHDVLILYGETEAAIAAELGVGIREIERAAREAGIEPGDKKEIHVTRTDKDEEH